ncbi:MAG: hypothetical protein D6705_12355 [Deltaproteobacteria bacterium]|nr:MAG: hypothetical protein D6705_12355 [Deltaproteobacteria bacterium]
MPAETTPTGARDGDPSARLGSWISARTKMAALHAASTKWTARNASASSSRVDGAGADVSRRSY